jgi:hypothetical protein
MNTENRRVWRQDGGDYQHVNGQWRIVPAWIGSGVELFRRADNVGMPPATAWLWSVHLAFDSLDEAAAYVRKVQKPVAVDV